MSEALLEVRNLVKRFGGIYATDDLSIAVQPGEFHAVIGPNGAGKTTLVAQLSGMLKPDSGSIWFDGHDITALSTAERARLGLARSFQITSILKDFTVRDNVAMAVQARQGHSFRFWRAAHRDRSLIDPAEAILERLSLSERADTLAANLAHGEQRQLEIAMVLASEPRMLLLDEPTAGMGPEDSQWMASFLEGLKGDYSIVLIEHDMDTVFSLADRISVLVYGRAIASGTGAEIRSDPEVRRAYLGNEDA
ncbi:MAG: ABC transporter ATP-binding protein [Pseudomonadota bacterium]